MVTGWRHWIAALFFYFSVTNLRVVINLVHKYMIVKKNKAKKQKPSRLGHIYLIEHLEQSVSPYSGVMRLLSNPVCDFCTCSKTPAKCWKVVTPGLTSWPHLSVSATTPRRPCPSPWPCASQTWLRSAERWSCGWRRPLLAPSTSLPIQSLTAKSWRSSSRARWVRSARLNTWASSRWNRPRDQSSFRDGRIRWR